VKTGNMYLRTERRSRSMSASLVAAEEAV